MHLLRKNKVNHMKRFILNASILAIILASLSTAQISHAETLISDRPDATESSTTVEAKHLQIEIGGQFTRDRSAGVLRESFSFPTLFRFGIIDPLELRIESNFYTLDLISTPGAVRNGFNDFSVGTKVHFTDGSGVVPSLGALASLNIPVGENAVSSNAVEPTFKLLSDWSLSQFFSLGSNVGIDLPARDTAGDKFSRFLYSVSLSAGIPGTGERLSLFAENAGIIPLKPAKNIEQTFNTGLTFAITPDVQIDASVQIGLTEAAPGLASGMGISLRI